MEQKKIFDQNCDFVKFSTSMFVFKCREKKYKNLKSSSRFTSPNSIILCHFSFYFDLTKEMWRERENHLNLQFSTYWCFLLMSLYICASKRRTPPWFLVGPWARGLQLCGWKNQGKKPDILSHFTRGVVNLTHFIFVFHYYIYYSTFGTYTTKYFSVIEAPSSIEGTAIKP